MASGTAATSPVSDAALDAERLGDVRLEQRDLALDDPDAERGEHGDAERREAPDQRRGEGRQHRERQDRARSSVTMGARKIAASADSPPAIAKFAISMRSGDHPALAATRRFSATAEVARPNSVPE